MSGVIMNEYHLESELAKALDDLLMWCYSNNSWECLPIPVMNASKALIIYNVAMRSKDE